ncbi:hypothetical protein RhiirA5_354755, partial [Rhizophagus irregularis]
MPDETEEPYIPPPILKRKGFGKEGRPIKVKVNSFEVTTISKYDKFLKYNIEIDPADKNIEAVVNPIYKNTEAAVNPTDKNIESAIKRERSDYGKNIRRRVLKEIGLKYEDWFQGVVIAYDGGSSLYTTDYLGFEDLNDSNPTVKEVEINIKDIQNIDGDSSRYKVKINRLDTVIELTQLEKYIKAEEFEWEFFSDEAFNVLNALIHKVGTESERYIQSGKSSIYDKGKKKI